ncbi:MAG TPA: nuclear transport factor 2 family protein [Gemmatimonadales bacterium]|nr:nuclear transport factor 2 family protein [Gemmatimonadales bacterium]
MRLPSPIALAALLLAACGGPPTVAIPASTTIAPDDRLSEVVAEVLQADARLEPMDSLYAPDALVIADGEVRYGTPRFAGIGGRGSVAVTATRLEVRGTMAWVQAEYRWVAAAGDSAREGRVTLILTPNEKGAWRIRHAHSSAPPPGL